MEQAPLKSVVICMNEITSRLYTVEVAPEPEPLHTFPYSSDHGKFLELGCSWA